MSGAGGEDTGLLPALDIVRASERWEEAQIWWQEGLCGSQERTEQEADDWGVSQGSEQRGERPPRFLSRSLRLSVPGDQDRKEAGVSSRRSLRIKAHIWFKLPAASPGRLSAAEDGRCGISEQEVTAKVGSLDSL